MVASIVLRRGAVVESRHRVHAAVTDGRGRLRCQVGNPDLVTFLRSAAKPFQALPLVEDGVVERFGIRPEELALCCASHNGEDPHLAGVRRLLERCGVAGSALACGPHLPVSEPDARALLAAGKVAEPIHNNCSGKHAGMLALARHRGWPLEGYHLPDHAVQRRMLEEMARWSGRDPGGISTGVDGCGVVAFALPLRAMAGAYARLGAAGDRDEGGARAVVDAMAEHPFMVAGTGLLSTRIMEATGGAVVVKVGAEGVYCALERRGRVGIALKVEDGARRAAEVALLRILDLLGLLSKRACDALSLDQGRPVPNTRGEEAAFLEAEIGLERRPRDPPRDAPRDAPRGAGGGGGGRGPEIERETGCSSTG